MKTIFYSFARGPHDSWTLTIIAKLRHLEISGVARLCWSEREITPGALWEKEIQEQIRNADAFLLLVNKEYLESSFIRDFEWPLLRDRADKGAYVFWIPVDVDEDDIRRSGFGRLLKYQTVNRKLIAPVRKIERADDSEFLLELAQSITAWARTRTQPVERSYDRFSVSEQEARRAEVRYLDAVFASSAHVPMGRFRDDHQRALLLNDVYVHLDASPVVTLNVMAEDEFVHLNRGRASTDVWNSKDLVARIAEKRELPTLGGYGQRFEKRTSLQDVFRQNRVLVMLGDPGSGKSLLCKWIVNQMAGRLLGKEASTSFPVADLGPARLPILLRVSQLAGTLSASEVPDLRTAIEQNSTNVLDRAWLAEEAGQVCGRAIEENRAVILIDGLDEAVNLGLRSSICNAIELFIARYVLPRMEPVVKPLH